MTPLPLLLSTSVQATRSVFLLSQQPTTIKFSLPMDKENNRPNTPTDPPSWIEQLFHELQQFQADFRQIELASRELRLITLENQQLLRELTATMVRRNSNDANLLSNLPSHRAPSTNSTRGVSSSTRATTSNVPPAIANPIRATTSNVATNSVQSNASSSRQVNSTGSHVNRNTSASTSNRSRQPTSSITTRTRANQAVRNAAVPIPRTEQSQPQVATRACWFHRQSCWFHRQFGITSAKCLPPCGFVAPIAPVPPIPVAPIINIPVAPIDNPTVPINNPPAVPNNEIQVAAVKDMQNNDQPVNTEQDPVVQQISEISIRPALERNVSLPAQKRLSSSSSSESDPTPSTSKQFKPADWNKLAKKESLSSSSSDSDSDD